MHDHIHGEEVCQGSGHAEHHHHHHHCSCGDAYEGVTVDLHEGMLVGTVIRNATADFDALKKDVLLVTEELKRWAIEKHCLIGHIKGYMQGRGRLCTYSTVGGEISVVEKSDSDQKDGIKINIVCILMGIEDEVLAKKLSEIIF